MKLSTRSTYGMRALVELGLAGSHGPLSAAAIARRQELSVAYLEQLLHRLKRQGMVTSVRGPRGGYVLAKPPQLITMVEVVHILDGGNGRARANSGGRQLARRAPTNGKDARHPACAAPGGCAGGAAGRHAHRVAQAVRRGVHERLTQALGEVTLQDLCDAAGGARGEPLDHRYVFHI